MSDQRPRALRLSGILGLGAIVAGVAAGFASYGGSFTETVGVTLIADRSGLIMDPGAAVTVRGVTVGEVEAVDPDGEGGARLTLALDPDHVDRIPSAATATIEATTVFGPKTVALHFPDGDSGPRVHDGAVLQATAVSTELNDVLGGLHTLLRSVDVGNLNAALGGVAHALDGRGAVMAAYAADLEAYLSRLNTAMPAIRADIAAAADVTGTYADAADDLVTILGSATVTSQTLVDVQGTLHHVLLGLSTSARSGQQLVRRVGPPLVTAVDALRPVVRLLVEFAPELTCTVQGLNRARVAIGEAFGTDIPALKGSAAILPGQQAYQQARDLPKLVEGLGPDCYQLPGVDEADLPLPRYLFDDGAGGVFTGTGDEVTLSLPGVTLYDTLFGTNRAARR